MARIAVLPAESAARRSSLLRKRVATGGGVIEVFRCLDGEIVEELLRFFVAEGRRECFSACLYSCYDYVKADVVMELAWRHGLMDFAMPFMINFMKETVSKVDSLQNAAAKQKVLPFGRISPSLFVTLSFRRLKRRRLLKRRSRLV